LKDTLKKGVISMKKGITLKDALSEQLKDKKFRRYYEEEGRRLAVGYKIAKLRHKVGWTQKELARRIHTSQATIARLERGDYLGYSLRTLEKIALATGAHLDIRFN